MMTSSNGNIFRVTGPLCGEFTGPGEFPTQRPVTRSLDVFFDLRLNKRLSKPPWGWWFETPSWSLWRQCNAIILTKLEQSCLSNSTELALDGVLNGARVQRHVLVKYSPQVSVCTASQDVEEPGLISAKLALTSFVERLQQDRLK